MNSLRGRTVWFLCFVTLAAGLMTAASEVVHAQSTESFNLSGTVSDSDGTALEGLSVDASGFPSKFVTRADGSYSLVFFSFTRGIITVGDTITITVTERDEIVSVVNYVVTAADIAAVPPGATVNIQLSKLQTEITTTMLPADGQSTATINVLIQVDGQNVVGDTVTITTVQGTVGDVTDNGDGTYTATYTAPELVLAEDTMDTITIHSMNTGETTTTDVTLTPVPTLVSVVADPNLYTADSGDSGMITVSVSRGGNPVADADVSVSRSRADGGTDTGAVGDVTNNGDGTYTATYTPSAMVGRVNLTATDSVSGASGMTAVNVNAGPPANVVVTVAPTTVSSDGSGMVTVMVTDSSGNPVGGLTPEGTATTGTVAPFTESDEPGTYTAPYAAPTVEEDGTDSITVTVGDITGETTVDLTPEPPMMVSVLVITGEVNKADGTGTVPGVDVAVTVNDHPPISTTTDEDGSYSVTIVDPSGDAGSTGDIVTVVVSDEDGEVVGTEETVLTNEDLGDGDSTIVEIDVDTNIVSTTSALVVTGTVYHEGGSLPVGSGMNVSVMNNANGMEVTGTTDADGMYSVTFFNPNANVAATGDTLALSVMADGAEIGSAEHTLSSDQIDAGQAMVDVNTNMKASTPTLVVTGIVYLLDSEVPAGPGLTVMVSNPDSGMDAGGVTDANGMYNITLFSTAAPVAETGDMLTVSVMADGEDVGSASHTLTEAQIGAQQAMVDVNTSIPAESSVFNIAGIVYLEDGMSPAPAGLSVTVMNANQPGVEADTVTMEGGTYSVTMVSAMMAVAATHDELVLDVTVMADDTVVGTTSHTLTTGEVINRRISEHQYSDHAHSRPVKRNGSGRQREQS